MRSATVYGSLIEILVARLRNYKMKDSASCLLVKTGGVIGDWIRLAMGAVSSQERFKFLN